jgi:hypothetical protein
MGIAATMAAIIASFIVLFISLFFIFKHSDSKIWNNGVCKESGKKWRFFDIASDGSRGYKDGEGHYIWISYDVDCGKCQRH